MVFKPQIPSLILPVKTLEASVSIEMFLWGEIIKFNSSEQKFTDSSFKPGTLWGMVRYIRMDEILPNSPEASSSQGGGSRIYPEIP